MARVSVEEWRTLEPLLDAALDAGTAERAAYLQAVCTDDPERRARLDELLVACERGEKLLLTPAESFAPLLRMPEVLGERYKILRELGHGGMATVYLADDPKHRRQVAVKVLDVGVSQALGDSRFRQEIEIAARLQHPHILPLFDSGDVNGLLYYVMPFVEGESLRDRLRREQQLPVEEAIQIAREVADALDFAHRRGVVHRDIKPENILLHEGRSMVADFGIALALSAASATRKTETGLLIGTPHYMSPEQASGGPNVTGRSDVYSLGVVLYEMLAGETPHAGRSAPEIIARIGTEPVPAVTQRRKSVPPNVAAAVAKATEPLPADRFGSAQDFAKALSDPAFRHGDAARAAPRRWNRTSITIAAVSVVVASAAIVMLRRPLAPRPLERYDVTPGPGRAMLQGLGGVEFALSADGSRIVYVGEAPAGGRQLWMRPSGTLEAVPIPGSAGAGVLSPVVSPDSRVVAFQDGQGITTIALSGGAVTKIVTKGDTPAWGSDQTLYFSRDSIIYRVPSSGGAPRPFTSTVDGIQWLPDALPDGRGLLLTIRRGLPPKSWIAAVGPAGGEIRQLVAGAMARYAASGHLVWAMADGTLMAAPFDLKRLEITGPSVPLLDGIKVKVKIGSAAQFALSRTGSLVYQTEARDQKELVWVSRAGGVEPLDTSWTGDFSSPSLSPDGTRLAVAVRSGPSSDIRIKRLDGGPASRLVLDGVLNSSPSWTADGRSLSFSSDLSGANTNWIIRTRRADGSAPAAPNADVVSRGADPRWSPDGQWLVYRTGFVEQADIMALRPGIDTVPVPLVATEFSEKSPVISPDGRWLAYTSNATGRDEVYVKPFPNTGAATWVVSTSGAFEPMWSRSGHELFYRNGRRQMVAVKLGAGSAFSAGPPTVLFSETGMLSSLLHPQYDVSLDDQRFLMIRQRRGDASGALILVRNVFDGLK